MTFRSASGDRILQSALRVMLPTDSDTDLLRAILHSGEAGRSAWDQWQSRVGNPLTAFQRIHSGQKGLVPLLHLAVIRNEVKVEPAFASFLRAAYFREELRSNAYRRILRETLAKLSENGSPPVVMRGCALSDTVYDVPQARHSHGIDLLLRDAAVANSEELLRSVGFKPAHGRQGAWGDASPSLWIHSSALPLQLHTQLLDVPYYAAPMDDVWHRVRPLPGWQDVARMLTPEDALIHVCGHAAHSADRRSLRWACDAWLLIAHGRGLDWTRLIRTVATMNLGLPMNIIMRYLAEVLDAGVPADAIATLDELAGNADDVQREIAVLGALAGAHAKMRRIIFTAPDLPARFRLLRCILAPSPACMREMGYATADWRLPYYYMKRPVVYALRTITGFSASRARREQSVVRT